MPDQSSQFEDFAIPAILLADMFSHSLVIIDTVESKNVAAVKKEPATAAVNTTYLEDNSENLQVKEEGEPMPALQSLGGFAKKILVLVSEEGAVHISDTSLELLGKMIGAVGLSIADIALVNLADKNLSLQQIHEQLDATTHLFFGIEPSSLGLPMRFPYFQVQNWNNKIFLYSPSLEQLNTASDEQTNQKRSLWAALKTIFQK